MSLLLAAPWEIVAGGMETARAFGYTFSRAFLLVNERPGPMGRGMDPQKKIQFGMRFDRP